MARWPAKPCTLPTHSNPDLRAHSGLKDRTEIGRTAGPLLVLDRTEMPIETAQLARFLIGKMLVRSLPESAVVGRIVETDLWDWRSRWPRLSRRHSAQWGAFLGVGARLRLPRLWRIIHAERASEALGVGAGVLIRAIEPIDGVRPYVAATAELDRALATTQNIHGLFWATRTSCLNIFSCRRQRDRLASARSCGCPIVARRTSSHGCGGRRRRASLFVRTAVARPATTAAEARARVGDARPAEAISR